MKLRDGRDVIHVLDPLLCDIIRKFDSVKRKSRQGAGKIDQRGKRGREEAGRERERERERRREAEA